MATSGSWEISWQSSYWSSQANTKYYHWKGNWSKSGNIITLSGMSIWLTFTQNSSGSGTDSITVTGGSAQSVTFVGSGYSSGTYGLNNTSFNVGSTDTSATIQCAISGEVTGSTTINFDATVVAPTINTLTLDSYTDTSVTITVSGNYGSPSSASGRYIEAGVAGQNSWTSPSLRSARMLETASNTFTVDNNSSWITTLTIQPNTQYWWGGNIANTSLSTNRIGGTFVTKASAAAITIQGVGSDVVVVAYSAVADGGYYAKTIEYSLDGGTTWATGATISSGTASSGTFTISGLADNTTYTLKSRVATTSGLTDNEDVTFTTPLASTLYGSVNGAAKKIAKFYGSVQTRTLTHTIVDEDGVFLEDDIDDAVLLAYVDQQAKEVSRIAIRRDGTQSTTVDFSVYYTDGTYITPTPLSPRQFEKATGISILNPMPIISGIAYVYVNIAEAGVSKQIKKLYGSVNGLGKLIYKI